MHLPHAPQRRQTVCGHQTHQIHLQQWSGRHRNLWEVLSLLRRRTALPASATGCHQVRKAAESASESVKTSSLATQNGSSEYTELCEGSCLPKHAASYLPSGQSRQSEARQHPTNASTCQKVSPWPLGEKPHFLLPRPSCPGSPSLAWAHLRLLSFPSSWQWAAWAQCCTCGTRPGTASSPSPCTFRANHPARPTCLCCAPRRFLQ
mmetsp:Transcript_89484/g.213831  ORF Transcript_89484/g.213831 Transcript_89484/m.213831 type:complete len:206 (-) Transcript_89484:363-980(-)